MINLFKTETDLDYMHVVILYDLKITSDLAECTIR